MRFWKPKKIEGTPKVGIAVAAYLEATYRQGRALECLMAAFAAQTHANWHAHIVHDGPTSLEGMRVLRQIQAADPERISTLETPKRVQQFGHPHRQSAVEFLAAQGCEWIGLTNQDNYYAPVYFEWMLAEAQAQKVPFVYCDMVRSHLMWKPFITRPKKGYLDLGGFLVHKSVVAKIKFDKFTFNGDGDYIDRLVQATKGRVAKVSATLFTHN